MFEGVREQFQGELDENVFNAANKTAKGVALTKQPFVPETFSAERKAEIAERRAPACRPSMATAVRCGISVKKSSTTQSTGSSVCLPFESSRW